MGVVAAGALEHALGVLIYGVLGQGMLPGKYDAEASFDESDRRGRLHHFSGQGIERSLRMVKGLNRVAARLRRTPGQVAIRWALDHPSVHCAIVGAKSPAQVDENAGAAGWEIPREERRELEAETA